MSWMNSGQYRNGPIQRPPNSVFGSSGGPSQQMLSPHLICGSSAAISCAIVLFTYVKYEMDNNRRTSSAFGIESILALSFVILTLLISAVLLIFYRAEKQVLVVCVQPSLTDQETQNLVMPDASNGETIINPPSYDSAMAMSKTPIRAVESLPPSYDNIFIV